MTLKSKRRKVKRGAYSIDIGVRWEAAVLHAMPRTFTLAHKKETWARSKPSQASQAKPRRCNFLAARGHSPGAGSCQDVRVWTRIPKREWTELSLVLVLLDRKREGEAGLNSTQGLHGLRAGDHRRGTKSRILSPTTNMAEAPKVELNIPTRQEISAKQFEVYAQPLPNLLLLSPPPRGAR